MICTPSVPSVPSGRVTASQSDSVHSRGPPEGEGGHTEPLRGEVRSRRGKEEERRRRKLPGAEPLVRMEGGREEEEEKSQTVVACASSGGISAKGGESIGCAMLRNAISASLSGVSYK
jgi:hypothetical protein